MKRQGVPRVTNVVLDRRRERGNQAAAPGDFPPEPKSAARPLRACLPPAFAAALALAHARSGPSALISGYLGKGDAFDRALVSFSVAYADQNEKDHAALGRAIRAGNIEARFEEER